jgi:hypothetical protein
MGLMTQFLYEKKWSPTTREEALKIIKDEMPLTDEKSTLEYILAEIKKGKIITLGECRFKNG